MSAKIELRHLDCTQPKNYAIVDSIELYSKKAIKVSLYCDAKSEITPIILDVSTAIKFAKTLRTEINKIKS